MTDLSPRTTRTAGSMRPRPSNLPLSGPGRRMHLEDSKPNAESDGCANPDCPGAPLTSRLPSRSSAGTSTRCPSTATVMRTDPPSDCEW